MNDVAKEWVKALRSGEYKQGRERLRTKDNTYCCLGVLTDLAVKAGVIPSFIDKFYLDKTTQEWCGLSDAAGSFDGKDNLCALSSMNDKGNSFAEIADIIESEPKGLFVCATK